MNEYIAKLVEQQRAFFAQGTTKDLAFRISQLYALKTSILDHQEEIIAALHEDLHRPEFESYMTEIHSIITSINHALACLKQWCQPTKIKTPFIFWPAKSYISYEPRGSIIIISPWNYPFKLSFEPLIGTIAAGNCAIIKPSEFSVASTHVIKKIIQTAFPSAYIAIVNGDAQIAEELLSYQFDYIFFTGSSAVGKKVMLAAAKYITPLTLELGGKNPCIITKDANLDLAAKKVSWGKFLNAGQSCVAPDYLLIDETIKEQFIELLKKYIHQFFGDDPSTSPDYGRIINHSHVERLKNLLQWGTIKYGGIIHEQDRYISPTLIDQTNLADPLMEEEIFGPLLPIITYSKFATAIEIINKQPKSLGVYLFTKKQELINILQQNTSSGALCLNELMIQAALTYLPFGGVGASGFGRYHGKKSFEIFSNMKTVTKNSSYYDLPFRYPPYGKLQQWLQAIIHYFAKK